MFVAKTLATHLRATDISVNANGQSVPTAALLLTVVAVCHYKCPLLNMLLTFSKVQRAFQAWATGTCASLKFTEASTTADIQKWHTSSVTSLSPRSWTKILAAADEFVKREALPEPSYEDDDAYVVQDHSSPVSSD
jgi:hypothetical protein